MSTNDTIVVPANGAGAASHPSATTVEEIDEESDKESYEIFKELTAFAVDLAKLVVRDGEGATKFVTLAVDVSIRVFMFGGVILIVMQGAHTYSDTHKVASRISTSALVKTALYGEDAKYALLYTYMTRI